MGQHLNELLKKSDLKDFAKSFKELEPEWSTPTGLLEEAVPLLALRTWEGYYVPPVSQPFLSFIAAGLSQSAFPAERAWWPFLQAAWFAARSRLRRSLAVPQVLEGLTLEELWKRFERSALEADFPLAYEAACAMLAETAMREQFRRRSLLFALQDSAFGGLKFLHLSASFAFAESLDWRDSDKTLFPALHFLVCGSHQRDLAESVESLASSANASGAGADRGSVADDDFDNVEKHLLRSHEPGNCLSAAKILVESGIGLQGIREALLSAAAQGLINSRPGHWNRPLIALLNTSMALEETAFRDCPNPDLALLLCARQIQVASKLSREGLTNRKLDEVVNQLCPADPLGTLRDVVSHSDPYAAATCVYPVLRMEPQKVEALFQGLATLAAKNAGHIANGLDLLLVGVARNTFVQPSTTVREKLPLACAFFLGRIPKNYDLIGAYGI